MGTTIKRSANMAADASHPHPSYTQVRNRYGLENVCASDSNTQCYCNWVNSYGVTSCWVAGGRRNICSVISKTAWLLDRVARVQHTFHFALQIFWKRSPPKHLKNYVSVTRKFMSVARRSIRYLCLDFTIICPKHKMLVFSLKMPKNTCYVIYS
jgi:hypothetical protein